MKDRVERGVDKKKKKRRRPGEGDGRDSGELLISGPLSLKQQNLQGQQATCRTLTP